MQAILSALAEPNRLHIVELLRDGPSSVGEIVERLGMPQPQVSKHLRVLSEAGVVEVHPIAQRRIYALRPDTLKQLEIWVSSYRHVWEEQYERLDEYLAELQEKEQQSDDQN
ncbi:MAG: metalloregulator ArsR/SmtB family transcription factor [Anaerolineae bacterium]